MNASCIWEAFSLTLSASVAATSSARRQRACLRRARTEVLAWRTRAVALRCPPRRL